MKINKIIVYQVNTLDIYTFLNKIKENKIAIKKLIKIDKNTYEFHSDNKYYKKIISIFKDIKVVRKSGLINILINMLRYKTTIIAMVLSVFLYCHLNSKIWCIDINGDNEKLLNFINDRLIENNIYVGARKISSDKLSEIQSHILYNNYDVIEYLSIKSDGCEILVNYKEKRKETDFLDKKGNLYASKDGLIKSFDLISGNKVVEINDYVKKGDLLVKDVITTDYNQEVYLGTKGSVYAYTWYYVTLTCLLNENIDISSCFANSLLQAKNKLSLNFSDTEYIFEENVLQFKVDRNKMYMKVHFTCVENIARE